MAKSTKRQKLVLFDGHALLHRGFHAIPYLSAADGTPTNGVYGFTTMMLKALAELKPDYVAVGWDLPGPTFRHTLYKEYKGTRAAIDPSLAAQIPITEDLIRTFSIPLVKLKGYEADDVIGALAKRFGDKLDVVIVTGDMDELQLVAPHVHVYTMRKGFTDTVVYDEAAVHDKYGVTPAEFIVYKALKGDTSDNIPGVAGIGDKTATELVAKYHTLEAIYAHLSELKPAVAAKLEAGRDSAELSQTLAAIKTDIKPPFELRDARIHEYDRQAVHELFTRLGFKSLLAKLPGHDTVTELAGEAPNSSSKSATTDTADPDTKSLHKAHTHLRDVTYTCVDTVAKLDDLIKQLSKQRVFAFDTETDSLDVINANLVGMSFSFRDQTAYYLPVGHDEGTQLPRDEVITRLKPLLENPKIGKVGHNIKYDYQILKRYGVILGPISFDTMVAAFLINPLVRALSLSELAFNELGIEMIEISELIGARGKDQKTFNQTPIADAVSYAGEDADISWRLYRELDKQLAKLPRVRKLAETTEWPLIAVLGDMEIAGVRLDLDFLKSFAKRIDAKLTKLEHDIWHLAGGKFNINSTAQLKEVLFDRLHIETQGLKKIKTGISTAASELEKLRGVHPIVDLLFEYREVAKLKSTYVDALPRLVNPTTGRVHTSYNQTIAQTGRLSSTNPNLQNIPIRTPLGAEVRNAFIADRGNVLVSADYSQIELRIAAALSGDQDMIQAFKEGKDIHVVTAAQLYGIPETEVSKEQRAAAKTINFGILYGMSPHGLSVATGMDFAEARAFIDRYFEIRQTLAKYIENLKIQAHEKQYTESVFGRRRPCPEIKSNNFSVRSAAERAAVNMPMQGTQADLVKLAMIQLAGILPEGAIMLLQIHDELIVECPHAMGDKVAQIMKQCMEQIHKFAVPIEVDTAIGKSWGDLG